MSRNPLIEAIHEARYDLQTCAERRRPISNQFQLSPAREVFGLLLHWAAFNFQLSVFSFFSVIP
jgi:hypothetical protein